MSKIEKAKRFFDNLQKLDYDPYVAVPQLSTITNFENENKRLQTQHTGLINECNQKSLELSQLRAETSEAQATLVDLNTRKSIVEVELDDILKKVKQESSRIEFAEALCLLFEDPSRLTPPRLMQLSVALQMTAEATLRMERPLQTDYTPVRKTALSLLEQVLGKSVVPREVFDNLIQVVEKCDDKMFDLLKSVEIDRAETAKMKEDVLKMTMDFALAAAAVFESTGSLVVCKCNVCKGKIAFTVVGQWNRLASCPICGATSAFSRHRLTEQN